MDKRHFTVVEKGGKEHGLYIFLTPSLVSFFFLIVVINNILHAIIHLYK